LKGRLSLPDSIVRAPERGDREQGRPLCRAYLDFYGAVETAEVTDAVWSRIFDPLEPVCAVVAVATTASSGLRITSFSVRAGW